MAKDVKKQDDRENKIEKKNRKKDLAESPANISGLKDDTLRAIVAVAFFVLGMFLVLAAFGKGGKVGEYSYSILHDTLFGIGYYLLPVLFFILCFSFFSCLM